MSTRSCPFPMTVALLLFSIGGVAGGAEQLREGDGNQGLPPLPGNPVEESQDLAGELTKLFRRVERNLTGIDQMLNDASAGDVALEEVQDSGLDDLLLRTQSTSQAVVSDIDKILELARKAGSCSKCLKPGDGSCSKPGDGNPKDSPLDRQRSSLPRDDEETPEQPSEADAPEKNERDGRPESPAASHDDGETRPGADFNPKTGEPVLNASDSDEWGILPPKIQEVFRNEGSGDVPVQYRDWIDAYYRRLGTSGR